ncbi:uncharacterized protein LOC144927313 [Branchiostoma floridae x Branchiostoma belcheri]
MLLIFSNRRKFTILSQVRLLCQGLQQCDEYPEDIYRYPNCPGIKKYLEVTYHCEEVKKNATFGGKGRGRGQFCYGVGGLAVSSTNEIFVADGFYERIQVFSMEGGFLRNFSTGNMKPVSISTGRNDTLWVVLNRAYIKYDIRQYSKEGIVLAKFSPCRVSEIYGIAWHKLSDRIILTISRSREVEIVWLTYSQRGTCKMNKLSATGSRTSIFIQQAVTEDTKGNIYVIDRSGSRILKYGENGDQLSTFGSLGNGAGNLNNPSGICVDSLGRVIVADTGNSRVEMFTAEGEHIRTIAYMQKPRHVATGGEGQLLVNQQNFVTIFPKY